MRSLVVSQAFEMRCYRRLLNISFKDHVTNEHVNKYAERSKQPLENMTNSCPTEAKDHISRSSGLAKTIMMGKVQRKRKKTGRQKKEVRRQY